MQQTGLVKIISVRILGWNGQTKASFWWHLHRFYEFTRVSFFTICWICVLWDVEVAGKAAVLLCTAVCPWEGSGECFLFETLHSFCLRYWHSAVRKHVPDFDPVIMWDQMVCDLETCNNRCSCVDSLSFSACVWVGNLCISVAFYLASICYSALVVKEINDRIIKHRGRPFGWHYPCQPVLWGFTGTVEERIHLSCKVVGVDSGPVHLKLVWETLGCCLDFSGKKRLGTLGVFSLDWRKLWILAQLFMVGAYFNVAIDLSGPNLFDTNFHLYLYVWRGE